MMAMYRAISIPPLPTRTPSRPSFDALDSADDLDIAPHVDDSDVSGDINSAIFATFPSLLSLLERFAFCRALF
ncbi:hypothetical protein M405DRAFT_806071 [Rhizopogon salebrosus TDB-379]|nr:hypothetical protein M405DRAFT_806071 [Rhizopogon salebrosus TDB-379]